MYSLIGKAVVKGALRYARLRYSRQVRIALGVGFVAAAIGAYLATREVPEG
jgi:hypothetical protein